MRMHRNTLLWLALFLAEPSAHALDDLFGNGPSFFEDHARGWFWYETQREPDPTPEPEPPPKPPEPPPASAPVPAKTTPSEEPVPLSAEWFRKNLDRYRDRAIDHPTPENVAAYYYLQRVMMDKAQRFTEVARHVVMSDPYLDETVRRPIATYAVNEANRQSSQVASELLSELAQKAGILFFFRSDCPYCHIQAPILAVLERNFGFTIYPVSLDGAPMPNGYYQDFKPDRGQAARLGIVSTPAIFLMKPPREIVLIAQSALSLEELTGRILLAAKEAGWIDDVRYQNTRGLRPAPLLVTDSAGIPSDALDDPVRLIEVLQLPADVRSFP
ncbi:conjugal transfer protein TraF [Methylocaldum szegediense]|uniref:conjugal transfer protein TraF n=1 Tax=Methylocaldum szegediense TaxID=73780 RepID=UPI0004083EF0|nr:conjugal transfer protein TraF [Methylocaldum szegediense]